jgi:hypothetical protein
MKERVKLIWDFRGPNASHIARHHVIHLKEFVQIEGLNNTHCDIEVISDVHHIAFLVVEKHLMNSLRTRLKPSRGQLYKEE